MTKHLLLLENPPQSAFDNSLLFKHLGFEVRKYPFDDIFLSARLKSLCNNLSYCIRHKQLTFMPELVRRNHLYYHKQRPRFADFDAIVIFVDTATKQPLDPAKLEKFRNLVKSAEKRKLSAIPILGIDVSSPPEFIPIQEELFDGLFLPGFPFILSKQFEYIPLEARRYPFRNEIITQGKMEEILERILLRPVDDHERLCLEVYFPRDGQAGSRE